MRNSRAKRHNMLARRIRMEIELADNRLIISVARRVKSKAAEVQSIILTESRIVALGILVQNILHRLVHADVQRIDKLDFCRRQGLDRAVVQLKFQEALPQ